jgi:hypothetical protein
MHEDPELPKEVRDSMSRVFFGAIAVLSALTLIKFILYAVIT